MPLDNTKAEMPRPTFYAIPYEDKVSIHFYMMGCRGLVMNVDLTDAEAQRLIDTINETRARLPRIGTAADLGVEVLP